MNPILEVKNLTYIYSAGTPFEHKALDNVSFSVRRGEFIGIIGHTGSGKSTLMQQLNGLLKPTSGSVLLDGRDIWADKQQTRQARFRVGLVFQYPEYQLFEETVYRDIAFGPKNMGLSQEEIQRRVLEAAGFVGITQQQLQVSPFDLSGGRSDSFPDKIPVRCLFRKYTGMLKVHGLDIKGQIILIADLPMLRELVIRPVSTAGIGADIAGVIVLPFTALVGGVPDHLGIRTNQNILSPSFQTFPIRGIQNLIILPFIGNPKHWFLSYLFCVVWG